MNSITIKSVLALGVGALTGFAADPVSSFEWTFGTSENPAEFTPAGAENPFGATWTADVDVGVGTGYYSGVFRDNPAYGTQTGMWDILTGGVTFELDRMPETTVDLTVTVRHFVSLPGGFPFSLGLSFSLPGGSLVGESAIQHATAGDWVESTYAWQDLTSSGPITLSIFSEPGRGFLLDNLAVDVTGILVPVPEPGTATLLALGAFGLMALGRKRV